MFYVMRMFCKSPEVALCGWRGYKPSINKQYWCGEASRSITEPHCATCNGISPPRGPEVQGWDSCGSCCSPTSPDWSPGIAARRQRPSSQSAPCGQLSTPSGVTRGRICGAPTLASPFQQAIWQCGSADIFLIILSQGKGKWDSWGNRLPSVTAR